MNFRRTLLWMMIACLVIVESRLAHAAEAAPPASPPRFLFIVEKSAATQALGLDVPQTMFDLVYRGANGHLPDGGVFEIWVFGEETILRGFSPQMLLPNNRLQLARMASGHVRAAGSGGVAAVGKMAEHLLGATELAQELTVFLLTAPDTRLSGTPRDTELNSIYDTNAEAQRAAGRPFITAIRIQDGLLAATSVSDSPFTMIVPPMPPTRMSPPQREALIAEARRLREEREQPPVVPPPEPVVKPAGQQVDRSLPDAERAGAIILKPETVVVEPATELVVVPPPVVAPGAETPLPGTPPQAVAETVAPAPATTPVAKPEPAPSETAAVQTPIREIQLSSRPTPAPADPPVILQFQQAAAIDTSLETIPALDPKPAARPTEAPSPAAALVRSQPVVTAPEAAPASAAPPPMARVEPRPAAATVAPPAPASLEAPNGGAPSAMDAVSAPTWFTAGGLFVAGIFFFSVAVLLTWLLMRRARTATGPSYITRSIDDRRS